MTDGMGRPRPRAIPEREPRARPVHLPPPAGIRGPDRPDDLYCYELLKGCPMCGDPQMMYRFVKQADPFQAPVGHEAAVICAVCGAAYQVVLGSWLAYPIQRDPAWGEE
jgi:hypothetical protein